VGQNYVEVSELVDPSGWDFGEDYEWKVTCYGIESFEETHQCEEREEKIDRVAEIAVNVSCGLIVVSPVFVGIWYGVKHYLGRMVLKIN
jgi:hypothetical protein